MGATTRERSFYQTAKQTAELSAAGVTKRRHDLCRAACGVNRPGKTRQDKARRGW